MAAGTPGQQMTAGQGDEFYRLACFPIDKYAHICYNVHISRD